MNLDLVGKDLHPTDELRTRIETKLSKMEARLGHPISPRVTLGSEGTDYTCQVHFTSNRHDFTAHAHAEDLFKATDDALHRIERQVRKAQHKGESNRKPEASIRNGETATL